MDLKKDHHTCVCIKHTLVGTRRGIIFFFVVESLYSNRKYLGCTDEGRIVFNLVLLTFYS